MLDISLNKFSRSFDLPNALKLIPIQLRENIKNLRTLNKFKDIPGLFQGQQSSRTIPGLQGLQGPLDTLLSSLRGYDKD